LKLKLDELNLALSFNLKKQERRRIEARPEELTRATEAESKKSAPAAEIAKKR